MECRLCNAFPLPRGQVLASFTFSQVNSQRELTMCFCVLCRIEKLMGEIDLVPCSWIDLQGSGGQMVEACEKDERKCTLSLSWHVCTPRGAGVAPSLGRPHGGGEFRASFGRRSLCDLQCGSTKILPLFLTVSSISCPFPQMCVALPCCGSVRATLCLWPAGIGAGPRGGARLSLWGGGPASTPPARLPKCIWLQVPHKPIFTPGA